MIARHFPATLYHLVVSGCFIYSNRLCYHVFILRCKLSPVVKEREAHSTALRKEKDVSKAELSKPSTYPIGPHTQIQQQVRQQQDEVYC